MFDQTSSLSENGKDRGSQVPTQKVPNDMWWGPGAPPLGPQYPSEGQTFQEGMGFLAGDFGKGLLPDFLKPPEFFEKPPMSRQESLKDEEPQAKREENKREEQKRDQSPVRRAAPKRARRGRNKAEELPAGHYFFPYNGKKYAIPEGTIIYPYSSIC